MGVTLFRDSSEEQAKVAAFYVAPGGTAVLGGLSRIISRGTCRACSRLSMAYPESTDESTFTCVSAIVGVLVKSGKCTSFAAEKMREIRVAAIKHQSVIFLGGENYASAECIPVCFAWGQDQGHR